MKKRYLFIIIIIGLAFASTIGYCQNKVWPYPIPCRIDANISPNVLFLSLGDVSTSIAQGMFYPVDDKVVLNDGSVIANYYRDSLGVEYYQPIDKTYYPTAPAGWCSWNAYRGDITVDTIKNVVDYFSAKLKDFGLSTILIDGGWEVHWYTWQPYLLKFPLGMPSIARYISDHGFHPGLWIVPQGTDDSTQPKLFDAFMKNADGSTRYTRQWGFTVDPTAPEGRQYVSQLMDTVLNWGFTYFKIDAQPYLDRYYDSLKATMSTPNQTHTYYYRQFISAVRDGVGPQVYLDGTWGPGLYNYTEGAWAPYTGIGFVNGGRPYWDIVEPTNYWYEDVFRGEMCYSYLNNIVCYVDLDDFYVRDTVDIDQSRAWATIIGLSGTTMMDEDPISLLSDDRLEILRRVYPSVDVRPIDLYNVLNRRKHVWDLKVNQRGRLYDVVGFFKTDYWYTSDLAVRWNEMGWNPEDGYHVYDFWNKQYLGVWKNNMPVDAPGFGCRLFSFVKADNYPELISTSRHITQGWVDLDTLTYDTAAMTMSGISSVVGGDPYELRFAVPNNAEDSYIAESAEVDSLPFSLKQDSNFITLDFTSPQSAHIPWKVHFAKGPLSVNANVPISQGVELYQNYPNPFGPGSPARTDFSTFSFFLPHSQNADLSIYDLLGRRIADVYNGFIAAGTFHIGFDGSHLPPGAYFSVLKTNDSYQIKPLVIER